MQHAEFGIADAHGIFQHGLEDRLQRARRRADDAQHVRGCRLLLQRFAKIVGARILSSRVFSMAMTAWAAKFDTSSICLSLNGAHPPATDDDRADQLVVFQHGPPTKRTRAASLAMIGIGRTDGWLAGRSAVRGTTVLFCTKRLERG